MAEQTGIEWCDATFNPWIGCEKVSPGCAYCYAETLVHGRMGRAGTWGAEGRRERTSPSNWKKPLRWAKLAREGKLPDGSPNVDGHRPRVFCASLADVFEERPELEEWRWELFRRILETPELDWLILTKRPEFMRGWFAVHGAAGLFGDRAAVPLPNVWLGVSIENARHTWRADVLREIPAAVRFLSCEPLLGSLFPSAALERRGAQRQGQVEPGDDRSEPRPSRAPLDLTGIDWVIVGGESGSGARPMQLEWAREIVEACRDFVDRDGGLTTPAVFVKQLGAKPTGKSYIPTTHGPSTFTLRYGDVPLKLFDRKGGDWDEWPADLRIREFPASAAVLA